MKEITLVIRVCDHGGKPIKEGEIFKQYCFPALMSNKFIYVKYEYAGIQKSGQQYLAIKKSETLVYKNYWPGIVPSREVFVTELNNRLFSTKFFEFYIPGVKEDSVSVHRTLDNMNKTFQRKQIPSKPIHTVC